MHRSSGDDLVDRVPRYLCSPSPSSRPENAPALLWLDEAATLLALDAAFTVDEEIIYWISGLVRTRTLDKPSMETILHSIGYHSLSTVYTSPREGRTPLSHQRIAKSSGPDRDYCIIAPPKPIEHALASLG